MVKIKAARVPGSKNKKKFKGKKVATTPKRGSKVMLKRKFKSSGKGTAGSQVKGSDARLKIISRSRSNIVDARDKLVSLAKGSDARQKLVKIRNLKEGKVSYITQHLLKFGSIVICLEPELFFPIRLLHFTIAARCQDHCRGCHYNYKDNKGPSSVNHKKEGHVWKSKKID